MKHFPKILTIFFLIIFIFQLACLLFLALAPSISQAADIKFTPQVQVGDYAFDAKDASTGNIARYVRAIYKYAIGIVGILAAVVLMVGGVMWIVAGGSATAIGEAKAWIGASLTGLLLALMSYLILATVNPALVDFKTTTIKTVTETKTQSTLKEDSPCTIGSAPYCDYGLECKDGKCAITNETKTQCEKSNYAWTESTNCDGPIYSDYFCSCKSGKTNITNKCCAPKFISTTAPQGGCCDGEKTISGIYTKEYLCISGLSTNQSNCEFMTDKGIIKGTFYTNKKCMDVTTIYGKGQSCQ